MANNKLNLPLPTSGEAAEVRRILEMWQQQLMRMDMTAAGGASATPAQQLATIVATASPAPVDSGAYATFIHAFTHMLGGYDQILPENIGAVSSTNPLLVWSGDIRLSPNIEARGMELLPLQNRAGDLITTTTDAPVFCRDLEFSPLRDSNNDIIVR